MYLRSGIPSRNKGQRMKLTKLRIAGFKTFVEPSEFLIEPGLTGIVGPNGCGKSNLVEALRWVMGENSSKNMRASGMEDVIFSGSGERPARNFAEVVLYLDNSSRSAPAAFNDSEAIEVSRKIEREAGSTYRINGREGRARDVQLLFADASTGARSPAMVRQGQIGEIIAAKPQERRRILEEAAGIAGLHSRRHEAELRLKAAEENLARLNDILQQIDTQAESLKKQARQAGRYRGLAATIRRHEALLALINHSEAARAHHSAEAKLKDDLRAATEKTQAQAGAAREQALAAHELPGIRNAEAEASSALQRQILAREALDGEERRAKARLAELERTIAQAANDIAREKALAEDAAEALARLDEEENELAKNGAAHELLEPVRARLAEAEAALALAEKALAEAQAKKAAAEARRASLQSAIKDEEARLARGEAEYRTVAQEHRALAAALAGGSRLGSLEAALEEAAGLVRAREEELSQCEARHAGARMEETRIRPLLAEAERKAQQLETQVATLSKLLNAGTGSLWPPVTEEIAVAKGYEAALVQAPAALLRRLHQIGVVLRAEGAALQKLLKPGQRLVSKEGDLWRWDGFTQAAEAPTAAARRLAEKNRLGDLTLAAQEARAAATRVKSEAERAHAGLAAAAAAENAARQAHKEALSALDRGREAKSAEEKRQAETASRLAALEEALVRLDAVRSEASQKLENSKRALAGLGSLEELSSELDRARAAAAQDRSLVAEASAEHQAHLREIKLREKRLAAIAGERQSWMARRDKASAQIGAIEARRAEAAGELEKLKEAEGKFLLTRQTLMRQIEAAEEARKRAYDARAAADRAARTALEEMSRAREEKARAEERVAAARARCEEIAHWISTELGCAAGELYGLAEVKQGEELPPAETVEKKLEGLRADRERLGGVNLRAEEELNEILASKTNLATQHEDLTEAIRRLRQAIHNLNSEGRERLTAAFESVQGHYKELCTTLFGGGSAELQLIESEDPLEAGLEIVARPPGKKPQSMTLLSGGEQALTAMALIFAIFLTNPAPVCVLDEVDAPLDDANVERFCDLLDMMRGKTETRFVAITHNPITMARMNRLFGVTMAERGVSQLVSVNLEEAQELRDAS